MSHAVRTAKPKLRNRKKNIGIPGSPIGPGLIDDNGIYSSMRSLLSQAFDDFDTDKNGYIDAEELENLCKMLGSRLSKQQVEELLQELDTNRSGSVDKTEFIAWWLNKKNEARRKLRAEKLGTKPGKNRSQMYSTHLLPQLPGAAPVRLLDARRNRKLTDRDTEMLRNRVKLLKVEELKTLKRISDANYQAAKIFKRKQTQTNKMMRRVENARTELKRNRTAQEQNYVCFIFFNFLSNFVFVLNFVPNDFFLKYFFTIYVKKELARISKLKAARAVVARKNAAAQHIKNERKRLNNIKKQENDQLRSKRSKRKKQILSIRQKVFEEKLKREDERAEQAELVYLSRVMHEQQLQREKEQTLRELEKREAELIGRLQNAHLMQEEALHSLGRVLTQ